MKWPWRYAVTTDDGRARFFEDADELIHVAHPPDIGIAEIRATCGPPGVRHAEIVLGCDGRVRYELEGEPGVVHATALALEHWL